MESECLICKEHFKVEYITLDCEHTYCKDCFMKWYEDNKRVCCFCFKEFESFVEVKKSNISDLLNSNEGSDSGSEIEELCCCPCVYDLNDKLIYLTHEYELLLEESNEQADLLKQIESYNVQLQKEIKSAIKNNSVDLENFVFNATAISTVLDTIYTNLEMVN